MNAFHQQFVELTSLVSSRLQDPAALAAVVVAAAGAMGMSAHGPPVVQHGPNGIAIGLLCRDGHIVLHTVAEEGLCLVDIVGRAPADLAKGVDVIARRLTQ